MSLNDKRPSLFGFHFKSRSAGYLIVGALTILSFPMVLWLIGYLGDCVASSSASYCNNLPDFVADFLFAFNIFLVVGGLGISVILVIAAVVMLLWGVSSELDARKRSK